MNTSNSINVEHVDAPCEVSELQASPVTASNSSSSSMGVGVISASASAPVADFVLAIPCVSSDGKTIRASLEDTEPKLLDVLLRLDEISSDELERPCYGFVESEFDGYDCRFAFSAPADAFEVGMVGNLKLRPYAEEDAAGGYFPTSCKEVVQIAKYLCEWGGGKNPTVPAGIRLLKEYPIDLPPKSVTDAFHDAFVEVQGAKTATEARLALADRGVPTAKCGYAVVIKDGKQKSTKKPLCKDGWLGSTTDKTQIEAEDAQLLGIPMGGVLLKDRTNAPETFSVDLDTHDGKDGVAAWKSFLEKAGVEQEVCLTERTQSGGLHLFFAMPREFKSFTYKFGGSVLDGVDMIVKNGVVVSPSRGIDPVTGREAAYKLISDAPVCRSRTILRLVKEFHDSLARPTVPLKSASNLSSLAPISASAPAQAAPRKGNLSGIDFTSCGGDASYSEVSRRELNPGALTELDRQRLRAIAEAALSDSVAEFRRAGVGERNATLSRTVWKLGTKAWSAPDVLDWNAVYGAFYNAAVGNGYLADTTEAEFQKQFSNQWNAGIAKPDYTIIDHERPTATPAEAQAADNSSPSPAIGEVIVEPSNIGIFRELPDGASGKRKLQAEVRALEQMALSCVSSIEATAKHGTIENAIAECISEIAPYAWTGLVSKAPKDACVALLIHTGVDDWLAEAKIDEEWEREASRGVSFVKLVLDEADGVFLPTSSPEEAANKGKVLEHLKACFASRYFDVAVGLEVPPVERFLLKDSLPEEGLAMLVASPACGKGMLSMQMQFNLALGHTEEEDKFFLPWEVVRKTRSLYISAEDSDVTLKSRQWGYADYIHGSPKEKARFRREVQGFACAMPAIVDYQKNDGSSGCFKFFPLFRAGRGGIEPTEGFHQLKAAIRDYRYRLVILDTVQHLCAGVEENSSTGWGEVAGALMALAKEMHICILLIHHVRKSEGGDVVTDFKTLQSKLSMDNARGSGAIAATCRWVCVMAPLSASYATEILADVQSDVENKEYIALSVVKKSAGRLEGIHYMHRLPNGLLREVQTKRKADTVELAFEALVGMVREAGRLPATIQPLWNEVKDRAPFSARGGKNLLGRVIQYAKNPTNPLYAGALVTEERASDKLKGRPHEYFVCPADDAEDGVATPKEAPVMLSLFGDGSPTEIDENDPMYQEAFNPGSTLSADDIEDDEE